MYTLSHRYTTVKELKSWINQYDFQVEKECLVQLFSGKTNSLIEVLSVLVDLLPNAHIVGATTDGEILEHEVFVHEVVISITVFKKTKIHSYSLEFTGDSYQMGKDLATYLDSSGVKAMLLFTTGLLINGEVFLNGVKEVSKGKYSISGGMAGDNANFKETFIVHNEKIINHGGVGVVLVGEELHTHNHYEFGWDVVGLPMTITKSDENRVYEIDNIPIVDIYKKYFGDEIAQLLPKIGVEIPLIITRDGIKIARASINRFEDGSLLFAGNVLEGEEVRFGIGNVDDVLNRSNVVKEKIEQVLKPETIFIYSCMARRRLLGNQASVEIATLAKDYSVNGFYTYGEFYSDEQNNYLFNETMTILALSESSTKQDPIVNEIIHEIPPADKIMTRALTHMTNVIAQEWQERVNLEIEKNKQQEQQDFQQSKLAQMGDMIGMIAHQWRQPLNAISATSINLSLQASMGILENEKVIESSELIQNQCQKMSATIDTFMNFVKPSTESGEFKVIESVNTVMQIMGIQLKNHDIEVIIESKQEYIKTKGHEDLLEQVLINLLSNARDAFEEIERENKFIKITLDIKDEIPIIDVEDNAGGIKKEVVEKIFNPYFTTKEQGKGTGIGLYMSLDIMQKSFKGNLYHENINDGSRFRIVIGGG